MLMLRRKIRFDDRYGLKYGAGLGGREGRRMWRRGLARIGRRLWGIGGIEGM
jgi:hypothetical protein